MANITKEELLEKTVESLLTAVESGEEALEAIVECLENMDNTIYRSAGIQFSSQLGIVSEYLIQLFGFYEQGFTSDPEEHRYIETDGEMKIRSNKETRDYIV